MRLFQNLKRRWSKSPVIHVVGSREVNMEATARGVLYFDKLVKLQPAEISKNGVRLVGFVAGEPIDQWLWIGETLQTDTITVSIS